MSEWMPIESAPTGKTILLWIEGTFLPWPGQKQNDGRIFSRAHGEVNAKDKHGRMVECKYWMPLPAPPRPAPQTPVAQSKSQQKRFDAMAKVVKASEDAGAYDLPNGPALNERAPHQEKT